MTSAEPSDGHRFFTRLPCPTARETEEEAARYIEMMVETYDRRILGPRTRRDGSGGLSVDFTYDDARPQVALEITELAVPEVMALGSELGKLEADLDKLVRAERLGRWVLGIRTGSTVKALRPVLVEFLRAHGGAAELLFLLSEPQVPSRGPGLVEKASGVHQGTSAMPPALFDLGLVSALRFGAGGELAIFPPVTDEDHESGFEALLVEAMSANVDKLVAARPRETHLAVMVSRSDLSGHPALTPAPDLVAGIDVLWVLLGYYNAKYTYRVWRSKAGDRRWQLLFHPWGEPPTYYPADPA